MAKLILENFDKVSSFADSAYDRALTIIQSVSVKDFLADLDNAPDDITNKIFQTIAPIVGKSYLQGKYHAWKIISAIPPRTSPPSPPQKLTEADMDYVDDQLIEPWKKRRQKDNDRFEEDMADWIDEMTVQGLSPDAILETIKQDWERVSGTGKPAGRRTGTWKLELLKSVRALVVSADRKGELAGFNGL